MRESFHVEPYDLKGHYSEKFGVDLMSWDAYPMHDAQGWFGTVLAHGNEVHVDLLRRPTSLVAVKYVRGLLIPLRKQHDFLVTVVRKNNIAGLEFCSRLGFFAVAEWENLIGMRLERVKYESVH